MAQAQAKGPRGLLDVGTLSRGLLAVSGVAVYCGSITERGGPVFLFFLPPRVGRFGRPRASCSLCTRFWSSVSQFF
jgi:hypothetical protein